MNLFFVIDGHGFTVRDATNPPSEPVLGGYLTVIAVDEDDLRWLFAEANWPTSTTIQSARNDMVKADFERELVRACIDKKFQLAFMGGA